MLTARSFVAWLLVALVAATGIAVMTHSPVDGAAVALIAPAGLISLLPCPAKSAPGEWRMIVIEPVSDRDVLWAEDWGEPLVPYRFPGHSTGAEVHPAVDSSGQVRADQGI